MSFKKIENSEEVCEWNPTAKKVKLPTTPKKTPERGENSESKLGGSKSRSYFFNPPRTGMRYRR